MIEYPAVLVVFIFKPVFQYNRFAILEIPFVFFASYWNIGCMNDLFPTIAIQLTKRNAGKLFKTFIYVNGSIQFITYPNNNRGCIGKLPKTFFTFTYRLLGIFSFGNVFINRNDISDLTLFIL